jgi:hypothetical protein
MRKLFAFSLILFVLAACQAPASDPNATARKFLDDNGKKSVKITKVVSGKPRNKADEVWCVETDERDAQDQTTLLTVYRTGSDWKTEFMESEYNWDLNGCPR